MAGQVRAREIDDDEADGCCRSSAGASGRCDLAAGPDDPLSAQGMPVAKIAGVSFISVDRVRDVIHNFTIDGFDHADRAGDRGGDGRLPARVRAGDEAGQLARRGRR
ncbi:hypothetical protein OG207_42240 [Streptomyces sp. NBC_01439]